MANNTKDTLFVASVNTYISTNATVPATFSVNETSAGQYTIGNLNGDVTLTIDPTSNDYIFTPSNGSSILITGNSITSLVADYIVIDIDASSADLLTISGTGILNITNVENNLDVDLSKVTSDLISLEVTGGTDATPLEIDPVFSATLGLNATVGVDIYVQSGVVSLPTATVLQTDILSFYLEGSSKFYMTQAQYAEVTFQDGPGSIYISNPSISFTDTGTSASDSITDNGKIVVTLPSDTDSWQYSLDSGSTWTDGVDEVDGQGTIERSFTLDSGTYDKQNILIKQFTADGLVSFSPMSEGSAPSSTMVKLEAPRELYATDDEPQITSIGSNGEYIVTFTGTSGGKESIYVQKFNADGTTTNQTMLQLQAIGVTNRDNDESQVTSIGSNGDYVVAFSGIDSSDIGATYSIFVQKFSEDGTTNTMVKLEALNVTAGTDDDIEPQVTEIGSIGEYVVTFVGDDINDDYGIFVQKFNADGSITNNTMVQLEAFGVTNNDDIAPQVTSVGTLGAYVVTFSGYDSNDDYSIFVQKFNANGTMNTLVKLEAPSVFDAPDDEPQITEVGNLGEYVVTFKGSDSTGGTSIFVQKFDINGTITGNTMLQLKDFSLSSSDTSEAQVTAIGTAGEYVVTFTGIDSDGDYSIFVQKFDITGTIANNTMVKLEALNVTNNDDGESQVTEVGNIGEYVVTFSGTDSNGDYSIFVQKFNSDGTITNNAMVELQAFGVTDADDVSPQVTSLGSNGEYVVTFTGVDSDGENSIFVQKFNADGTVVVDTSDTLTIVTPPTIINPSGFTITDTGTSSTDNITSNGEVSFTLSSSSVSWEFSIDNGTTWIGGEGSSFTLSAGLYDMRSIKVQQTDTYGFLSISSLSDVTKDLTIEDAPAILAFAEFTLNDTGSSSTDLISANGTISFYRSATTSSWQYSTDNGTTWTDGIFVDDDYNTFTLTEGYYEQSHILVKQFNLSGGESISAVGNTSMVQLEGINNTDYDDTQAQVTAIGTAGEYVVVFTGVVDATNDKSIFVQKFNADGTTTNQIMVELDTVTGANADSSPQVTSVGTDGKFVVTYIGSDGSNSIFVQKFDSAGAITGTQVILEGVASGFDQLPQITEVGTSGEYVVAYYGTDSNNDYSIFVQKFDSAGATSGSQVQLEGISGSGIDQIPQITAVGTTGEYVVTFQGLDSDGDDSIFVQKFNADGTTTNQTTDQIMVQLEAIGNTTANDHQHQVTVVGDSYVVTFRGIDQDADADGLNDYSIFVQKFNAAGAIDGNMVQLESTDDSANDNAPQVAAVGTDGNYVVTFYGVNSTNGETSIFIQNFNADGTKSGTIQELKASGNSIDPQITSVGTTGEYVITFTGVDSDGDDSIFVQKFNADGTRTNQSIVQLEAIGNTNAADAKPQVTELLNGEYVVTFNGIDSNGDDSIFVQKFNADGTILGTLNIDQTAPSESTLKAVSTELVNGVVSFTFSTTAETDSSISYTLTDAQGILHDSSTVGTITATNGEWSDTTAVTLIADGIHTLAVTETDLAGNATTSSFKLGIYDHITDISLDSGLDDVDNFVIAAGTLTLDATQANNSIISGGGGLVIIDDLSSSSQTVYVNTQSNNSIDLGLGGDTLYLANDPAASNTISINAEDSSANADGSLTDIDIIDGFISTYDSIVFDGTSSNTIADGTYSVNSLDIVISDGLVSTYNGSTITTVSDQLITDLFTFLDTSSVIGFKTSNDDYYVLHSDEVVGIQNTDIIVKLTGVAGTVDNIDNFVAITAL